MSLELSGTTGVKGVAGSVSAPSIVGDDTNTGISFPSADTIKFSTGGVERMQITNSGVTGTGISNGKILSVQQAVKTDTASFSTGSSTVSDSYFDISGLSVTLTPSSGTKCLINYTVNIGGETDFDAGIALLRGSTQIYLGDASGSRQRLSSYYFIDAGNETYGASGQFLDTHGADGSTAVTYKLQMYVATPGRTTRVNRSHDDADDRGSARLASQITVMEVAA